VSIFLIVGQSNEGEKAQRRIQEKADRQEKELRSKLDQSLLSQEYTRGQLDSIGLMVGKLGEAKNNLDMKNLATAITTMVGNGRWKRPHILSITARNPGAFQITHNLGCIPSYAVIQVTSFG
jgi:(p)ppGpp synthase/HD superfamily hydrolase